MQGCWSSGSCCCSCGTSASWYLRGLEAARTRRAIRPRPKVGRPGSPTTTRPCNSPTAARPAPASTSASTVTGSDRTRGSWACNPPANTTIDSVRVWRALTTTQIAGDNTYEFIAIEASDGAGDDVERCHSTKGCTARGNTAAPFGNASAFGSPALPAGINDITLHVTCNQPGQHYCKATGGPPQIAARIHRPAIVLRDDAPPTLLSPPAGTLTSGAALSGAQNISFSAEDKGGGIHNADLELDGTAIDTHDFGCAYTHVVPCKLADGGTLSLDTARLADGQHTARLLVPDATSTNTTPSHPITITTANTPTTCATDAAPSLALPGSRTIAYGAK